MKKIKYVGYYEPIKSDRNIPLAGKNKMEYIIKTLSDIGYEIEIVSPAMPDIGRKSEGSNIKISENISIRNFDCYLHQNKFLRAIDLIKFKKSILKYLIQETQTGDIVIVYHSLFLYSIIKKLTRKRKINLVMEIEEIYTDVKKNLYISSKQERKYFDCASKYIFPTSFLNDAVNYKNKDYILVHGVYKWEKSISKKFNDNTIHVVYAGTFNPQKGGAIGAIKAARFLDEKYCVHILGFGSEEEKRNVLKLIEQESSFCKCRLIYEGEKKGRQFLDFLQKCDIGLSTQNPDGDYNNSSFPSKILTYMSNGLEVVSINIPVVKNSYVNEQIYYYDTDNPEEIAKAILRVELTSAESKQKKLEALDEDFKHKLKRMLEY